MTNVIVLFNLRDGVDRSEYENGAKSTDLPTVRGLDSIPLTPKTIIERIVLCLVAGRVA